MPIQEDEYHRGEAQRDNVISGAELITNIRGDIGPVGIEILSILTAEFLFSDSLPPNATQRQILDRIRKLDFKKERFTSYNVYEYIDPNQNRLTWMTQDQEGHWIARSEWAAERHVNGTIWNVSASYRIEVESPKLQKVIYTGGQNNFTYPGNGEPLTNSTWFKIAPKSVSPGIKTWKPVLIFAISNPDGPLHTVMLPISSQNFGSDPQALIRDFSLLPKAE